MAELMPQPQLKCMLTILLDSLMKLNRSSDIIGGFGAFLAMSFYCCNGLALMT
jgi:hypothetical protein